MDSTKTAVKLGNELGAQTNPENQHKQETINPQPPWQSIPANWQTYDHQAWIQALKLTDTCPVNVEGNASRFLQTIQLDAYTQLLLLACELGAYQDAYYGFLLQAEQNRYKPLTIKVPKDENGLWSFVSRKRIWGSVWKEDKSEALDITFLSAATGMCGHRSFYPVQALIHSEASMPSRAYADKDCYNGVRVEAWPEIK